MLPDVSGLVYFGILAAIVFLLGIGAGWIL